VIDDTEFNGTVRVGGSLRSALSHSVKNRLSEASGWRIGGGLPRGRSISWSVIELGNSFQAVVAVGVTVAVLAALNHLKHVEDDDSRAPLGGPE
jgi:hypothetical protein